MKDSVLYILDIVRYYLKAYRKAFNDTELYKVLLSDPSFPSLASICRTLKFYDFNSVAYKSDKTNINQINGCIIHTISHGGHFFIVLNCENNAITLFDGKRYIISKAQFLKIWDGIMLVIEESRENNKSQRVEKIRRDSIQIVLLSITTCLSVIALFHSLFTIANVFLDAAGIYLCSDLIRHRIGLPRAGTFCKIGEKFDCDYVSSKQPLLNKLPMNFEEVGLSYFCWELLAVLIYGNSVLTIVGSFFAIFLSVLLAAYQIIVIKKYCMYCFCLYVICIIQGFASYYSLRCLSAFCLPKLLISNLVAVIAAIVLCILFTRFERLKYRILEDSINLLRIKRTPEVFRALSTKKLLFDKANLKGLRFGKENADCEIVIFASLSCTFCRKAINGISLLMERFPNKFKCIVILTKSTRQGNDNNQELALVEKYLQGNNNIDSLTKGKKSKNIGEISKIAKILFDDMEKEVNDFSIVTFPFIVVDGYVMSKLYKISDYQYISSGVYIH